MAVREVTTHSIRYRILKVPYLEFALRRFGSYNPFDPIQDTESSSRSRTACRAALLQPIRSDTGY